jgi:predicted PurR-regulated permease PerM
LFAGIVTPSAEPPPEPRRLSAQPEMAGLRGALYFARAILVPFALAVLLSFLLAPVVRWLRRLRIGRAAAVLLTVLIAFVVILGFAAFIGREVTALGEKIPEYSSNIEAKIRSLPHIIGGGAWIGHINALLQQWHAALVPTPPEHRSALTAAGRTAPVPVIIEQPNPGPFDILRTVIGPLLAPLESAGLVIVFVFLILLEREDLRDRVLRLAGARDLQRTTAAMNEAMGRIARYLSRQLAVNASCAVPIGVGLAIIGIPNAALWGAMVLVLRFLPYLGILVAAAFPVALAIAVDPGWHLLLWTIALFVGVETIVSYAVEPLLYGASTGLSSVAVIGAAVFWTWLWGPIGLLLSTPLTVCLVVLGRYVPQLRFLSVLLGNEPGLAPEESLYQRLLARDPEEASEQAEDFAKARSLAEFFDAVMVPALALAQADSERGALSATQRALIRDGVLAMIEHLSEAVEAEGKVRPLRVVCVAGRNELDEAAAAFVAYLLRLAGHDAAAVAAEAIPAGLPGTVKPGDGVLCLSLIGATSPARIRYLARRLRRRLPEARLVLGLWGARREEIAEILEEALPAEPLAAAPQLRRRLPGPRLVLGLWGARREEIESKPETVPSETIVTTFREFLAAIEKDRPQPLDTAPLSA